MGKSKKTNKSSRKVDAKTVQGRAMLGPLTAANSGGAFVIDKFELDTDLTSSTTNLSKVFNKWRPKRYKFSLITVHNIDTQIGIAWCVIEDPLTSAPTTIGSVLENKFSGGLDMQRKLPPLKYVPDRKINNGWFFTEDSTSDIRLECPGNLFVATWGASSALAGFYILVDFELEFMDFQNETVSPAKPISCPPSSEEVDLTPEEEKRFKKWVVSQVKNC